MRYLSVVLAIVLPLSVSNAKKKIYHSIIHVPHQKEIFATLTLFSLFASGGAAVVHWLDNVSITRFFSEFVSPSFWCLSDEVASILVLKTLYNGFRLRQFPGSWLWKLSDLTYVFHAVKADLDYQVYDLHRKYGTRFYVFI